PLPSHITPLSLHDALPISAKSHSLSSPWLTRFSQMADGGQAHRTFWNASKKRTGQWCGTRSAIAAGKQLSNPKPLTKCIPVLSTRSNQERGKLPTNNLV